MYCGLSKDVALFKKLKWHARICSEINSFWACILAHSPKVGKPVHSSTKGCGNCKIKSGFPLPARTNPFILKVRQKFPRPDQAWQPTGPGRRKGRSDLIVNLGGSPRGPALYLQTGGSLRH
ncbi:hypothetical protein X474_15005 [Dethiosulfatarculus sandiegensis]|uniref:Uncharacterized protein n=1 Tax=Dethiosulfatarculus sandiegensis TaxID=1429043 RepID=A0A0D2JUS3_9BACT|nr:hypothetical protein X474_15005 [Dethiosulfatarculus sandiegensis]